MKFYYTKTLLSLFDGYKNVETIEDFWIYMNGDLLDHLYWEYDYGIDSNSKKSYICPDSENSVGPCLVSPVDRNILYENKLLGLPRIRMLKVQNDSCDVPMIIKEMRRNLSKSNPSECFDHYSKSSEDKLNFGLAKNLNKTQFQLDKNKTSTYSAWSYNSEKDIDGTPFNGNLGFYSGAGFIQDLASSKIQSKVHKIWESFRTLFSQFWISFHPIS